jgi:hypothetical protein
VFIPVRRARAGVGAADPGSAFLGGFRALGDEILQLVVVDVAEVLPGQPAWPFERDPVFILVGVNPLQIRIAPRGLRRRIRAAFGSLCGQRRRTGQRQQ